MELQWKTIPDKPGAYAKFPVKNANSEIGGDGNNVPSVEVWFRPLDFGHGTTTAKINVSLTENIYVTSNAEAQAAAAAVMRKLATQVHAVIMDLLPPVEDDSPRPES